MAAKEDKAKKEDPKAAKGATAEKEGAKDKPSKKTDEERSGLSLGLTSKLGVVACWSKVLDENTARAKKFAKSNDKKDKPLTDEEIVAAMQKEFPRREKFQPVSRIRSWYNNGRYNLGKGNDEKQPLDSISVAYGTDGKPQGKAVKEKAPKAGKTGKDIKVTGGKKAKDDEDGDDEEDEEDEEEGDSE